MVSNITEDSIKKFLEGENDEQYIVGIEPAYDKNIVYLIINDPVEGFKIKYDNYYPFMWIKDLSLTKFYGRNKNAVKDAMNKHSIVVERLETHDNEKLVNGYKFLVKTTKNFSNLVNFFKEGGIDPYKDRAGLTITIAPVEQYLIQKSKRFFKGFKTYDEVHKLTFDIETTGLNPDVNKVIAIGVRDNRGLEKILLPIDNSDEAEVKLIGDFFTLLDKLKPAIICGYFSESFDFDFLIRRLELFGYDPKTVIKTLSKKSPLRRKPTQLKVGNKIETYTKTMMWGYNVIDTIHAVKRAEAINSDIKSTNLKYIAKFTNVAKKNRVYIPGKKIASMFYETENEYEFDNENGKYVKFSGGAGNNLLTGREIVTRYLLDDLEETEKVDNIFNQSSFLLAKIIPTTYQRVGTMGTAASWKLLMLMWSYHNKLAIPYIGKVRDFVGGLSRVLNVGYTKHVVKFDYNSLYPSIQLTHDIFPDSDVTGVLKKILSYFHKERMTCKALLKKARKEGDKVMERFYDAKQLPIKALNNSMYGSLTAPLYFYWADIDKGELITCTARQYLRMMIKFLMERGFKPLTCDTDGSNFGVPEDISGYHYVGKGLNWTVEKNKEYHGVEAVVSEFNDTYMRGVMALSIDKEWGASINFSKKNYANLNDNGKVELTGNTLKDKTLQTYISEFINTGFEMLLNGKGAEFVEYYYSYIEKLYNKQIPLIKIANKSKVNLTVEQYKDRANKKNINGEPLPRMCHMELIIENKKEVKFGDVAYYVNNGKRKSHGDIGHSYLIDEIELETNPDLCGDYNVPRYIDLFNKRVNIFLVVFKPEIRNTLLVDNPENRNYYTAEQMELISGIPLEEGGQDDIQKDVFDFSEKENLFWEKSGLDREYMFPKNS